MSATILNITDRSRTRLRQISSLDNFTTTPDGSLDAAQIVDNPAVNLYCLDHANRQAIFAEMPPEIDLAQAPFYYQAQFDHAQRLIAVPYAEFHQLAEHIPFDLSRLILIHNIGRCGSTLLSSAFNQLDTVISFSEPDVFADFVPLRHEDRSELIRLLHSSLRFTFRPAAVGQAATYGLKLRNQCIDILDFYVEALPQAKHLLLYRSLLGWVSSLYGLWRRNNRDARPPISREEALNWQAAYYNRDPAALERLYDPAFASYTTEMALAVGWLIMIDRCFELSTQGIQPLTLRYENLNHQPERVLAAVFDYCNLPIAGVAPALQAFAHDSQENTKLARGDAHSGNQFQLPGETLDQIQAILHRQPTIRQADFVLPGTLMFD